MRSHEERVAAVRQRITQEEQKKRLRRSLPCADRWLICADARYPPKYVHRQL